MTVSLIVAAAENDVIGRAGDLPWRLPGDLIRFRELTTGHVVVAGHRTHDSIVRRLGHPLPGRITVVVSRDERLPGTGPVLYESSVEAALSVAAAIEAFAGGDEVFVIGGAEVYRAALPAVDRIYLTRVHAEVDGDVRMPAGWLAGFTLVDKSVDKTEAGPAAEPLRYSYLRYDRT